MTITIYWLVLVIVVYFYIINNEVFPITTDFVHFACAARTFGRNARFEKPHSRWSGPPTFQSWLTACRRLSVCMMVWRYWWIIALFNFLRVVHAISIQRHIGHHNALLCVFHLILHRKESNREQRRWITVDVQLPLVGVRHRPLPAFGFSDNWL